MDEELETRTGRCESHGTVTGARKIPRMGFPFIWFAAARALARRRPFRCPECDQPVTI
jgi:hypothetical protein